MMPMVPPAINALCQAAEAGIFPKNHKVRWIKSGAAPLAPELARRLTDLTGISVLQGYGMTEASPVTHVGYLAPPEMYRPASIGQPLALTDCRILDLRKRPRRKRSRPRRTRRTRHARPAIHARILEGTASDRRRSTRWLVLLGRHRPLRRRRLLLRPRPPQRDDQVQRIPRRPRRSRIRPARTSRRPRLRRSRQTRRSTPEKFPAPLLSCAKALRPLTCWPKQLRDFVADRLAHHKQPREIHFVDSRPADAIGQDSASRTA